MNIEKYIQQNYTDIVLSRNTLFIYSVRMSILRAVKEVIPNLSGTVLDLGCGIQPYKELILENSSVSRYIGLDFEISICKEYSMRKPDIFWDGVRIPLENNSVDCTIATEVLEHCPNPEIVLKEIYRVLKPGGLLFFTVPFVWPLHLVPYDEYRYTPYSLERHLLNSGFKNLNLQSLGGVDAALAQMLSIWAHNRCMSNFKKRILQMIVIPIVRFLLNIDNKFNRTKMFYEGSMITGISGVCRK